MGVGQQAFSHGHRQIWDAGFFDERTNIGVGLGVRSAFAKKDERTLGAFEQVERAFDRVWSLVPIYVMVSSAVKPLQDVQGTFTWWPSHFTLAPFRDMWTTIPLARYFVNSLVVATASSLASVFIALLAAYSISRYRFRGRRTFTFVVLSTQMFPGILFLLPLFVMFVNISNVTD